MKRADVEFASDDVTCRGWLYRPTGAEADVPCVVMAHGFSLTRHDGLASYAEAFAGAGAAVLAYDHRGLGDSDGERQWVSPFRQIDDRRAAVAFARRLDGVDPDRIVVWGYSMGGGGAVAVAATDPRVAAAILVCPHLDGRWRTWRDARADPRNVAWVIAQSLKDRFSPTSIPAVGRPGEHAGLTFAGECEGAQMVVAPGSPWKNAIRAGPTLAYGFYRPVTRARDVRCPVLVQLAMRDVTVSVAAIDKFAQRVPHAVVRRYDIDHWQPFYGELPTRFAAEQVDWLNQNVLARVG